MRKKSGFTLIELIIVLAISAVMAGFAIVYSNVGQNQVALTLEAAKISQFILQARELAVATYGTTGECGAGILFDTVSNPQTYSIFIYKPPSNGNAVVTKTGSATTYYTCPSLASTTSAGALPADQIAQYTPGTWQVPLSQGVTMSSAPGNLTMILFYPPLPTVFLSTDQTAPYGFAATAPLNIDLATVDGGSNLTLSVNGEGQVDY